MKKTALLLCGLILIPILILGWLSVRLEQNQQQLIQHQFQALVEVKLQSVDNLFQGHFQRLEAVLKSEASVLNSDTETSHSPLALRQLIKASPYIEQIFILSPTRERVYPRQGNATAQELQFLQQTKTLLDTPTLFAHTQESLTTTQPPTENSVAPQKNTTPLQIAQAPYSAQLKSAPQTQRLTRSGENTRSAETEMPPLSTSSLEVVAADSHVASPTPKAMPKAEPTDSGWIAWYNNTQLQHIYWQTTPDNRVIGFAISRARLLSDLINLLPDQSEIASNHSLSNAVITLKNSRGELSYEWGDVTIAADTLTPIKSLNLSHPLGSWRLDYATTSLNKPEQNWLEKLLILVITLSGLSTLGWLIYREQTRESRLALQRVNFVNQVSHELKTPLTNVRMYTEMLESQLDDEQVKQKRYLSIINNESKRLTRLIDNVLSFSKLERDSLDLTLQMGTVQACINTTLDAFTPAFTQRGIKPVLTSQCDTSVLLDPHCVEQILNNLFSNTEKYAANSGTLQIECWQEHDYSFIRIHDNGPGIDEYSSRSIFDQFYRASNKLTDGVSGTGIGLSIARELARKHGGDLILESTPSGACFLLSLHTPISLSHTAVKGNL